MEKNTKKLFFATCVLVFFILLILLLRLIKLYDIFCMIFNVITPVLFGYILAWFLHPIYKKISIKTNKTFSFILLIVLVLAFYGLLLGLIIPFIIKETPHLLDALNNAIEKIANINEFSNLKKYIPDDLNWILKYCNNALSIIIKFALAHLFAFYILLNYEQINSLAKKSLPAKYKNTTLKFVRKVSTNMRYYLKGTLIDMSILFVFSFILFKIIGLKYTFFLALFCAITNIIPFIGPYIGGIPAILMGLSVSFKLGIITFVIIIICQIIESNIINPVIMSKCIKINPLLIVLAITIMGEFLGFIGMILAVPLLILIKLTTEFYKQSKENVEHA